MLILARCVALLIVLLIAWQAAWTAFLAASFEPSRPLSRIVILTIVSVSLGLGLGYALIAAVPLRIATAGVWPRAVVLFLIMIPCSVATYLLVATSADAVAGACLLLIVATLWLASACIWPAWLARPKGR